MQKERMLENINERERRERERKRGGEGERDECIHICENVKYVM